MAMSLGKKNALPKSPPQTISILQGPAQTLLQEAVLLLVSSFGVSTTLYLVSGFSGTWAHSAQQNGVD